MVPVVTAVNSGGASSATVLAYKDKDFKGAEIAFTSGQRIRNLSELDMSNDIESMKINCGK
ncbi:MAG TPA: hypothetical protein VF819_10930 [Nitrospira sp.]